MGFLSLSLFLLMIVWALVWNLWKFDAVTLPTLCWCQESLLLWPRVSVSTLFTWSLVIWHSFKKSGAVCSNGFPFISWDDMKLRALWGRGSGRPSSLVCSIEWSKQADGTFSITPLIRADTLSLVSCLSWGFRGSKLFFKVKLAACSLGLSSRVFLSLRKTRFFIWVGATSFLVPLFHPCGTLVHAGDM